MLGKAYISKINQLNQDNKSREPQFDPDQRFSNEIPLSRKSNQHTRCYDEIEEFNSAYRWLITVTEEKQGIEGIFVCWEPKGPGIDTNKSGYHRMGIKHTKVMCHVFSWLYHHPGETTEDGDISHLCHNSHCCRPSHLFKESRSINKSREGCAGYAISSDDPSIIISVCRHLPSCCVARWFSPTSDFVDLRKNQ